MSLTLAKRSRARGFTLLELLVVIAIVAVLIGLLIPAVQRVRDRASQVQCLNNLHQLGIAFQSYHNENNILPAGNQYPWYRYYGYTWRLYMLPYLEQNNLYSEYSFCCNPERGSPYGNSSNTQLLNHVMVNVFQCPASPLPRHAYSTPIPDVNYMLADYAGVSGSYNASDYYEDDEAYPNERKSFGGVLQDVVIDGLRGFGGSGNHPYHISGTQVSFPEITDGLSNTMIVVEQSDWCRDGSGTLMDCRSGTEDKMFTMGPCCADWLTVNTLQLTTVLHPVGFKSSTGLGVPSPHSPIQSVHPSGANVLFVDGSARFLSQTIDIRQLYRLADANDGLAIDTAD